ncbi:hypothetical protein EGW08_014627 [Elysia chlorotica]|uniref:Uncharacterized protein n=1 Tax=Elysia chlorotica TaxID=188477 RepID=A0A433T7S0_ELYCH|nr:hypothetical protein EGW08_014627 [Elysia chlorotica]
MLWEVRESLAVSRVSREASPVRTSRPKAISVSPGRGGCPSQSGMVWSLESGVWNLVVQDQPGCDKQARPDLKQMARILSLFLHIGIVLHKPLFCLVALGNLLAEKKKGHPLPGECSVSGWLGGDCDKPLCDIIAAGGDRDTGVQVLRFFPSSSLKRFSLLSHINAASLSSTFVTIEWHGLEINTMLIKTVSSTLNLLNRLSRACSRCLDTANKTCALSHLHTPHDLHRVPVSSASIPDYVSRLPSPIHDSVTAAPPMNPQA